MRRAAFCRACLAVLATASIGTGQVDWAGHKLREPRRLNPGAAVCVNTPLNLAGMEMEPAKAGEELAERIRAAGFASGLLGTQASCDAVVFTEITGRNRKTVSYTHLDVYKRQGHGGVVRQVHVTPDRRQRSLAKHRVEFP